MTAKKASTARSMERSPAAARRKSHHGKALANHLLVPAVLRAPNQRCANVERSHARCDPLIDELWDQRRRQPTISSSSARTSPVNLRSAAFPLCAAGGFGAG